jgi:hypothetical protein
MEMNVIQQRLTPLYPAAETGWEWQVQDLVNSLQLRPSHMLLMLGAVGFVLADCLCQRH